MTAHPPMPAPLGPVVASAAAVFSPAEQAAKAQAKAVKKARKHARLRAFAAWCWGCQAVGGSF